ncbi:ribonuclease D [Devriesea agamarum]|uniref:ribonuclease D n=1 Tax=Devriesea agamarum TaxID=472569 RepID=UPI001E487297|nr:HRDC domain-containing protein [Devriesea agamarum]
MIDRIQPLLEWCAAAEKVPDEPVAIDAERASSFRYSHRAYLIQLRTDSAGTALIDPLAFAIPSTLRRVLSGREWVLHAASQDLPCLAELDLVPTSLFDTELAARLLGMPRVGLGAVVEDTIGVSLAKEHSAADWSRRPLPQPWLAYAALDVELLVKVRNVLAERLIQAGKDEWARQEFDHLVRHGARIQAPKPDAWRHVKGITKLVSPQQLAVLRELWLRRDDIARAEDLSPHRVLHDRVLIAIASRPPASREEFGSGIGKRLSRADVWWRTIRSALDLPACHWPGKAEPVVPPPPKLWGRKHPERAQILTRVRAAITAEAEKLNLPQENLIPPAIVRSLIWEHGTELNSLPQAEHTIATTLDALGARPWQVAIAAPVIDQAIQAAPTDEDLPGSGKAKGPHRSDEHPATA